MSKSKSKQASPKTQLVTIVKSQNYKWAILAVLVLVIGLPLFYYLFPRQPVSKSTYFTTPIPSNTLDSSKAKPQPKDLPPEFQRTHTFKPLAAQRNPPVSDDDHEVVKHSQGWHVAQQDQGVAIRPITQRTPQAPDVVLLHEHVIRSFPHDATCFTQGYAFYGGELFESCGLYGRSSLRHINYETGKPTKSREMPREHFGEGLIVHYDPPDHSVFESIENYMYPTRDQLLDNGKVFVLTWRERVIHAYNARTLEPLLPPLEPERRIPTEGWGIVVDPLYNQFIISDGSSSLFWYDMNTMKLLRQVTVTKYDAGRGSFVPQVMLNELEWIGGRVWANIWQTDNIVVINPDNGQIERTLDASKLHKAKVRGEDVLNGIAFGKTKHNGGETKLLVTGKLWKTTFELDWRALVPVHETKGDEEEGNDNNDDEPDNDTETGPESLSWDSMSLWVQERQFGQVW